MKLLSNIFLAILIFITMVPINYFFSNNFNALPIQLVVVFFIFRLYFSMNLKYTLLISLSIFVLLMTSDSQFNQVLTSGITATFFTIYFILFAEKIRFQKNFKDVINILFIVIIAFTTYYNIDFYFYSDLSTRSKAFGSGSIFSIISLYGFAFLMLNYYMKHINKKYFYPLFILFLTSLIFTQVRGVILTMAFIYIVLEFKSLKKIKFSRILFTITIGIFLFQGSLISERFNLSSNSDINQLTSGRLETQLLIVKSIFYKSDNFTLLFGHGINSIKQDFIPKGLEFPHLDILYLLYEGGLFLLIIYLLLMYQSYKLFNYKLLFLIFLISSFHTNMILSPGFLFVGFLMDKYLIMVSRTSVIKTI
jgi:hypothetical protein